MCWSVDLHRGLTAALELGLRGPCFANILGSLIQCVDKDLPHEAINLTHEALKPKPLSKSG